MLEMLRQAQKLTAQATKEPYKVILPTKAQTDPAGAKNGKKQASGKRRYPFEDDREPLGFVLSLPPTQNHSLEPTWRMHRGVRVQGFRASDEAVNWFIHERNAIHDTGATPFLGLVSVSYTIYRADDRSDCDGYDKKILDVLQSVSRVTNPKWDSPFGAYINDRQVKHRSDIWLLVDADNPRIEVMVRPIPSNVQKEMGLVL